MNELERWIGKVVEEVVPEATFTLSPEPPASWPFPNDHEQWLIVSVNDEQFVLPVVPKGEALDESPGEFAQRLRESLADWAAESRYAWGQRRG